MKFKGMKPKDNHQNIHPILRVVRWWENYGWDATHVCRLRQTEQGDFFLSVVEKGSRVLSN